MSVIVLDGPEKAGKSTLVEALYDFLKSSGYHREVLVRHWVGRAKPDDSVYSSAMAEDSSKPPSQRVTIWDRSWASEFVYGRLLAQDRRLARDPWLGEWLYGRAASANGLMAMLSGPDPDSLRSMRDATDLPVDPAAEQSAYLRYARLFNWMTPDRDTPSHMASAILERFYTSVSVSGDAGRQTPLPPTYCGPVNSRVIFVGERRSDRMLTGGWLPFSSHFTTLLGRRLGTRSLSVGWTNAHDCPPSSLRGAKLLVACGDIALKWVTNYVLAGGDGDQLVMNLPHPAYVFRYNNQKTKALREDVTQKISDLLKEVNHGSQEN